MKKLGIALLAISMCFACGDGEEREALAEGEYENLEDAYTRDNATLDALDRCDVAAATVYNDDELLSCEAAFESCSNIEIGRLTNKLECEAGFTENCDEEAMTISPECAEGYASIAPPNNGAWTDFQAWASGTQWCGAGTDLVNTGCPVAGGDGGDMACHRHDHGKKANGIIGGMAVKLGCDIDHGLAKRTSNSAAQAVFGSWGLGQTWGCYDHGSYSCWNWASKWWGGYWRYGNYCSGEHGHYGPWRYSSYDHSYGWNSQSRCTTNLCWTAGCDK
jgi:hypothetical protein